MAEPPSIEADLYTPGSLGLTRDAFVDRWNAAAPVELQLLPHGFSEGDISDADLQTFAYSFDDPPLHEVNPSPFVQGAVNTDGTIRLIGAAYSGDVGPVGRRLHEALLMTVGLSPGDAADMLDELGYDEAVADRGDPTDAASTSGDLRVRLVVGHDQVVMLVRQNNLDG